MSVLDKLEKKANERRSKETIHLNLRGYDDDLDEEWRVLPLTGDVMDKIFGLLQNGKMIEAWATALVNRVYHPDKNGRMYREKDIPRFMKDPKFLSWWAEEVKFHQDVEDLGDPEVEKKDSKTNPGTTSSSQSAESGDDQ